MAAVVTEARYGAEMPGVRVAVVVDVAAAVVAVAVVVTLVLLAGADASLSSTDRDNRPVPTTADPRSDPPPASAPPAVALIDGTRECTDADLDVAADDLADDPGTTRRRLALVWVNRAGTACGLEGFGIVDLVGPAAPLFGNSRFGSIVNVPRDAGTTRPVILAPGESVRSLVRWDAPGRAAGRDGQVWTPDRIVLTTPGERRNQSLAWGYGPVLVLNGGKDRPGPTFGPISAG